MKTILVVDDDSNILYIVKYFLSREGYTVITSANPERTLELAKKNKADLIILDVMMKEKDGLSVCEELAADDETYHIPVLFLTAKSDTSDKVLGFLSGGRDYITKPFEKQELIDRVANILK